MNVIELFLAVRRMIARFYKKGVHHYTSREDLLRWRMGRNHGLVVDLGD